MDASKAEHIPSAPPNDLASLLGFVDCGVQPSGTVGADTPTSPLPRIDLNENNVKNSLGQLVLSLIKLLHELLERQAIRRMDSGSLSDTEIEKLGLTLMQQAQEIEKLRELFGLEEEDLNLDLGPFGKLF